MNAIISTSKGDMTVELYEKETPVTVENFVKLIKSDFYDGLSFHRVIPDDVGFLVAFRHVSCLLTNTVVPCWTGGTDADAMAIRA